MRPTKLYRTTGGSKGNSVVFHTDAGKLTARQMLKYSNLTSTARLLYRLRTHGDKDIDLILDGPPTQKRAGVTTMTTSFCPVCGDEFPHPETKRRKCCSRNCALQMARREDEQGTDEYQAIGRTARKNNLRRIAIGSFECRA